MTRHATIKDIFENNSEQNQKLIASIEKGKKLNEQILSLVREATNNIMGLRLEDLTSQPVLSFKLDETQPGSNRYQTRVEIILNPNSEYAQEMGMLEGGVYINATVEGYSGMGLLGCEMTGREHRESTGQLRHVDATIAGHIRFFKIYPRLLGLIQSWIDRKNKEKEEAIAQKV